MDTNQPLPWNVQALVLGGMLLLVQKNPVEFDHAAPALYLDPLTLCLRSLRVCEAAGVAVVAAMCAGLW
jgi:hypothetical protein